MTTTLRELYAHNDWARDKICALAADLPDEKLDRPFEIGFGSLRETLRHLYGAECVWFERWRGDAAPRFPRSRDIHALPELWETHRRFAAARDDYLDGLGQKGESQRITYSEPSGRTCTHPLGDMMLHVTNHGVHHRAQALNMLRRLGVKVPGLDYLYMRLERPTLAWDAGMTSAWRQRGFDVADRPDEPAAFDVDTIREYFRYSDWATAQVLARAVELNDAQLDCRFEIGLGTLRKTLAHIHDAEQWWCHNWAGEPEADYKAPEMISLRDLTRLIDQTIERRNAFLDLCSNDDLQRPVHAQAAPGAALVFRLGESMLQLPAHGTHHRAQAANMLRHLGAEPPGLDYILWIRDHA
jgi:uncharacterized damage-inducible protein DinB